MTVKLTLASSMAGCPICWEKFVAYCQQVHCAGDYWSVPDEIFAEELAKFNARVNFGRDDNYVEFSTDADKTHFVLRWS